MKNKSIKVLAILALISTGFTVRAAFHNILWNATAQMLDSSSDPLDVNTAAPLGNFTRDSLYALYFTPTLGDQYLTPTSTVGDGSVNWASLSAGNLGNNNVLIQVARDDFQFASRNINQLDEDYQGNTLASVTNSSTGYFYTVVFDFNDASVDEGDSGTWNFAIPNGSLAYISPVTSVAFTTDIATPSTQVHPNEGGIWPGGGGAVVDSAIAQTVLIPEPSAIIMMVLAGLAAVLGIRRGRN